MSPAKQGVSHRVLLMDDDEAVRAMMCATLERKGFDVVPATNVTKALKLITTESFDVLITDLHMPNHSDGFAVITAMRHSQPDALTLLVSGYPDVKSAMDAILLQADEIIVKPFEAGELAELVHEKLLTRKPSHPDAEGKSGGDIAALYEPYCRRLAIEGKKEQSTQAHFAYYQERTGHLPKLIEDLIIRLREPNVPGEEGESICSAAAVAHGKMRQLQGYTPGMLVHDSRILQVTLFGMLQSHPSALDFSLLLPDVMTIADEVDSQLTQAMDSYMNVALKPVAA